jgi:putative transcriptional regulator
MDTENKIILYQDDNEITRVAVRFADEDVWLTQTQLAEMVGSSKNTISSIETSQFCPTAYLAALLCIALDCKFEDLFYFEEV